VDAVRIAREAGVQRLEAQVLAENSPCLAQSGHLIVGGRDGSGGGTLALENIMIIWEDLLSHFSLRH